MTEERRVINARAADGGTRRAMQDHTGRLRQGGREARHAVGSLALSASFADLPHRSPAAAPTILVRPLLTATAPRRRRHRRACPCPARPGQAERDLIDSDNAQHPQSIDCSSYSASHGLTSPPLCLSLLSCDISQHDVTVDCLQISDYFYVSLSVCLCVSLVLRLYSYCWFCTAHACSILSLFHWQQLSPSC